MTTSKTPEEALLTVPGWERATYCELSGGVSNRTYLVESGDAKAVLKIDDGCRSLPYNARKTEAQIQTLAADRGLAGRVLFVSDTVYMTEYLEGTIWSGECLEDNTNLDALAAGLKKLHALPLTGRTFDAIGAARDYIQQIEDADPELVGECLRKIKAGPMPHNLCCCHNDLVVANIINTPEIRFLDWEYACDNDPFFDLATVVAHHELTAEQSDYLLDAYFDGDGKRWREQLARQASVYEALLWLWDAARA
ncbi:MAG: choline/ethanolamine kinase family protein [Woeseiaceae bacterium]|nr:choline/ethanolamine kinase family protein [Woeseiaceae bacterium]MDX2606762.1 choline/ethanolamine kinase family protein [Woeseiaceae bacterium]